MIQSFKTFQKVDAYKDLIYIIKLSLMLNISSFFSENKNKFQNKIKI